MFFNKSFNLCHIIGDSHHYVTILNELRGMREHDKNENFDVIPLYFVMARLMFYLLHAALSP